MTDGTEAGAPDSERTSPSTESADSVDLTESADSVDLTESIHSADSVDLTESIHSADSAPSVDSTGPDAAALLDRTEEHPVLLFDGVCNLCNRWIQFVIEHDPGGRFRFAPLQSAVASALLDAAGYEGPDLDSVVLVDDGECYAKSDAVIRVGRHLGGVYRLLGPFAYVPRVLRDFGYDFVANRRYGWFGKREACMRPTPDVEERFLEFEADGD